MKNVKKYILDNILFIIMILVVLLIVIFNIIHFNFNIFNSSVNNKEYINSSINNTQDYINLSLNNNKDYFELRNAYFNEKIETSRNMFNERLKNMNLNNLTTGDGLTFYIGGLIELKSNHIAEAESYLKRAIQLHPMIISVLEDQYWVLIKLLIEEKKYDDSIFYIDYFNKNVVNYKGLSTTINIDNRNYLREYYFIKSYMCYVKIDEKCFTENLEKADTYYIPMQKNELVDDFSMIRVVDFDLDQKMHNKLIHILENKGELKKVILYKKILKKLVPLEIPSGDGWYPDHYTE